MQLMAAFERSALKNTGRTRLIVGIRVRQATSRLLLVVCLAVVAIWSGSFASGDAWAAAPLASSDEPIEPPPPPPEPIVPPAPLVVGDTQVYQEYAERMRSAQMVSPLGSDLFGENVNLFDGQTSFSNVDISIPGNSALPVELRRKLTISRMPNIAGTTFGGIGNWDIDVPYVSAVFVGGDHWGAIGTSGTPSPRCSAVYHPTVAPPFSQRDILTGASVHLPGRGDSELYTLPGSGSAIHPTDGQPYLWTTQHFDAFTCTTTLKNAASDARARGQGFVMKTTEGVVYTFDWMAVRGLGQLGSGEDITTRNRVYLLATKIEDRYGNRVEYTYNDEGHPLFIRGYMVGSPLVEREIGLTYTGTSPNARLQSATAHGRTWNYEYQASTIFWRLTSVLQPTSTDIAVAQRPRWSYVYSNDRTILPAIWDGDAGSLCQGSPVDSASFTLEITHPAGAKGVFDFDYVRKYRSGIPLLTGCLLMAGIHRLEVPNFSDGFALDTKTITGTGLTSMAWDYQIDGSQHGYCGGTQPPCADVPLENITVITEPDSSKKLYRFGVKFGVNHGRLLGT